jgi:transposase
VLEQIVRVEADRDALLEPTEAATPAPGASLTRLKGIAEERAAVLGTECLWRAFDNRRQLGAYAGIVGSPFKSGNTDQEQGLSKSGNKRLRRTMIELAWSWLQHQPQSALSLWFNRGLGPKPDSRRKKILIAALARKLLIALWRFDTQGVVPEGAVFKAA